MRRWFSRTGAAPSSTPATISRSTAIRQLRFCNALAQSLRSTHRQLKFERQQRLGLRQLQTEQEPTLQNRRAKKRYDTAHSNAKGYMAETIDIFTHNQAVWNRQAAQGCAWSEPVSSEEISAARAGTWSARLTPGPLPSGWLDDVRGLRILCLAAGGGQQAPILAAAGADVTVFDFSAGQLAKDQEVAARDGLELRCVQGDMRDLSVFEDASFDLVFHPISNLYIPDVRPVWHECARVLQQHGQLLSSFWNPVVFVADRDPALSAQGLVRPNRRLPYSDIAHLPAADLAAKQARGEALVFGHTLADQIGGQLDAGFVLTGFHEDWQPHPRFVIENAMPTFMATKASKM